MEAILNPQRPRKELVLLRALITRPAASFEPLAFSFSGWILNHHFCQRKIAQWSRSRNLKRLSKVDCSKPLTWSYLSALIWWHFQPFSFLVPWTWSEHRSCHSVFFQESFVFACRVQFSKIFFFPLSQTAILELWENQLCNSCEFSRWFAWTCVWFCLDCDVHHIV